MSYTPMIMQYLEIKERYPESILFFRLGDFYEMFFEDAIIASADLEITLTGREGGKSEKIPMCGVPHHAAENYISRLIQKGHKVAICEQVEDPSLAQGIVKREVVRVITPGTVLDGSTLEEKNHNYLVALVLINNIFGLAVADISTGLFQSTEFSGSEKAGLLADEIARLRPAEIIIPESLASDRWLNELIKENKINRTVLADRYFNNTDAIKKLNQYLGEEWKKSIINYPQAINASGSLLCYLELTQMNYGCQIKEIEKYTTSQYVLIDQASRKNLEITNSIRDGGRWGTLIWVLDRTKTAMGGRLIRNWLEQPLTDPEKINFRLDGVEELFGKTNIRDDLAKDLKHIYDMERLSGKAVFGTANARDLLALNNSFKKLPELKVNAANLEAAIFRRITQDIDSLDDISSYLYQAIIQDPPVGIREGGLIRDGFDPEVDRLKRIQREGRQMLADLEMEERENSGIKSLKIGYNKVFGYYLEVTKSYINLVPDYFIRKQTLANAERYITPKLKEMEELILSSEDRLVQLEYNLFVQIREKVATAIERIQKTSRAVAILDALLSLSEVALEENYIRPRISNSGEMSIVEGRHPVVEKVIGIGEFVPNDTLFNDENKIILLTGPNMAGKSTYMRQVALLVLMAQIGSFVPATKAQIGVVDKIFTRIGAADDLAGGLSTFMVEMMECKSIVNGATETSLVIMDEVGRGTSTYDGISIARALVEYIIANLKCRTLFSTHYHELTDLDNIDGVSNYTVSAQEQDNSIIFLRKVLPGKADRSYGIHVAALAGLPEIILGRAQEILSVLENNKGNKVKIIEEDHESCGNMSTDHKRLIAEIAGIDISAITPLEAMNFLAKMQLLVNGK